MIKYLETEKAESTVQKYPVKNPDFNTINYSHKPFLTHIASVNFV